MEEAGEHERQVQREGHAVEWKPAAQEILVHAQLDLAVDKVQKAHHRVHRVVSGGDGHAQRVGAGKYLPVQQTGAAVEQQRDKVYAQQPLEHPVVGQKAAPVLPVQPAQHDAEQNHGEQIHLNINQPVHDSPLRPAAFPQAENGGKNGNCFPAAFGPVESTLSGTL